MSYSNFRDCIDNYIIYTVNSHHCINITAQGDCQTGEGGGAPARHVVTDRETGEVAAIAFPATAVATVATCAAATVTTFAAAACAAFVAKVRCSQHAARASCLGVSERPRVQQHAARVHAKLAMAECPDGSLEIWPVTGSTVTWHERSR